MVEHLRRRIVGWICALGVLGVALSTGFLVQSSRASPDNIVLANHLLGAVRSTAPVGDTESGRKAAAVNCGGCHSVTRDFYGDTPAPPFEIIAARPGTSLAYLVDMMSHGNMHMPPIKLDGKTYIDIGAYILSLSPSRKFNDGRDPATGQAGIGHQLAIKWCNACHQAPGLTDSETAAPSFFIMSKSRSVTAGYISHAARSHNGQMVPAFFGDREFAHIAAYIRSLAAFSPDDLQTQTDWHRRLSIGNPINGRRMAAIWCSACHAQPDYPAPSNTLLSFQEIAHSPRMSERYLLDWILNAREPMPRLGLPPAMVADIIAYIKSLSRKPAPFGPKKSRPGNAAPGQLVALNLCNDCHITSKQVPGGVAGRSFQAIADSKLYTAPGLSDTLLNMHHMGINSGLNNQIVDDLSQYLLFLSRQGSRGTP